MDELCFENMWAHIQYKQQMAPLILHTWTDIGNITWLSPYQHCVCIAALIINYTVLQMQFENHVIILSIYISLYDGIDTTS